MRLIDADALIISLAKDRSALVNNHVPYGELRRIDETIWKVAESPTLSAAPVVRGEWIEKTYIHEYANEETEERQYVVCGICGKQPPSGFGAVNFCHNCGADMRRESEGST